MNKNNSPGVQPGAGLDRREFIKTLGGGITVFFAAGAPFAEALQRRGSSYPDDFNAYLKIAETGEVSCFTGKIEMGQGIYTSLAQMLAEDLEVPLDRVEMVMGDTKLCPWDSSTTGSRSTKYFGPPLRRAAAEAKAVLLELASERLSIPKEYLIAKDGAIHDGRNKTRKITYAELTRGQKIERHLDGEVSIKPLREHTVSGVAHSRSDALEKVTGTARYSADVSLPGMLYARLLRPPAHGATLSRVDVSPARQVRGAVIVEEGDFIAVLHESPEEAEKALEKIVAHYEIPESEINNETVFEHLERVASTGEIVTRAGDLERGRSASVAHFDTTYATHYVAHAPLEPHAALVHITDDEVQVWASTSVQV